MKLFTYINIFDTFLKLAIAYAISIYVVDRLIFYAVLLAVESAIVLFLHYVICNRNFDVFSCKLKFEKSIFKMMFVFSSWSIFRNFSNIMPQNGFLHIINIFFGVVANAAMGIANQVVGALNSFILSFQTYFYPQIVKAYVQGDTKYLHYLISRISKFSFELMIILALILLVNINT